MLVFSYKIISFPSIPYISPFVRCMYVLVLVSAFLLNFCMNFTCILFFTMPYYYYACFISNLPLYVAWSEEKTKRKNTNQFLPYWALEKGIFLQVFLKLVLMMILFKNIYMNKKLLTKNLMDECLEQKKGWRVCVVSQEDI